MNCPYCSSSEIKVVDKRDNNDTNVIRRRRECESCGKRFTTYERIETINLYVVKRTGKIQEFDREKLKHGILRAVKKRDIPEKDIEELVISIEQQLLNYDSTEIKAEKIGQLVLEGLKQIDDLGYLLFASVYKDFQDIGDFEKALKEIKKPRS
jgi:transcriptional repressor NrdR